MLDLSKIKVIIWDLDETLWSGTLSEGNVALSEDRFSLLNAIVDSGVINTICSKNDYEPVSIELKELGIWDLFVFPSINWDPKGLRVKTLLKDMSLRPANALFIDDNISNIKEVEYYNEGIMTASPDVIPDLIYFFHTVEKTDLAHKRLKQYKILEAKHNEAKGYNSNIDFLEACDIRIEIVNDPINWIDRIFELVQRTNQLNFTKVRCSLSELKDDIISPNNNSGCVRVKDRFGDYGIVGFYLMRGGCLKHFLFSCRTIGMGVEQFVYSKLGYPPLQIVPDVATTLSYDEPPHWIKEGITEAKAEYSNNVEVSILFKGPCDMSGLVGYLQMQGGIETDFTFTNDCGCLIETHNHSSHVFGSYCWSPNDIELLKKEAFFFNDDCINKCDLKKYRIVFLSTLIEGIYGRYKHRDNGLVVAFGHYNYPLTDRECWTKYIYSTIQDYGYTISYDQLASFTNKFDYVGRTSPDEYITYLKWLLKTMSTNSILCLILGSEISYENETDPSYIDRADYHAKLNAAIRSFASCSPRIRLIEITHYIHSQSDYSNNINHFTPSVYYSISRDVLSIIRSIIPSFSVRSSWLRFLIKQYVQPFLKQLLTESAYNRIKRFFS